jgi:hypothetical protein
MSKVESYIWKDAKLICGASKVQNETRLIDMDQEQLQTCYTHCKNMLYNTDPKNLGRMIVLDTISKQLDCCGAELALRYFISLTDSNGKYLYTADSLLMDLHSWTRSIPDYDPKENYRLQDFVEVPAEYQGVSIELLMKACRDGLGNLDHSKITKTFIYDRLGLYLTTDELYAIDKDLEDHGMDPNKITLAAKIENHVKFPLGLSGVEIKINPKGLTGEEFKDMVNLKKLKGYKYCKYSALTSNQLKTLRYKVLFELEERTLYQIKTWKTIMQQIEEVAKYKHYKLS